MIGKTCIVTLCSIALASGCIDDQQPGDESELAETSADLLATANRVGASVATICINGAAFTGAFSAALNNAIVNYNALPLTFNFVRTTGGGAGCHAVITAQVVAGFGVTSGFPSSSGLPFNVLGVGNGFGVHNADVLEHLITHLLGHNIGLLHTDSSAGTPVSCGPGQVVIPNFGGGGGHGGGIGGIMTPGSPPPSPGGSIMNSCIPVATNGEFTSSDITGLNFLY